MGWSCFGMEDLICNLEGDLGGGDFLTSYIPYKVIRLALIDNGQRLNLIKEPFRVS